MSNKVTEIECTNIDAERSSNEIIVRTLERALKTAFRTNLAMNFKYKALSIAFLLLLVCTFTRAEKQRDWRTGKVLDSQRSRLFCRNCRKFQHQRQRTRQRK